MGRIIQMQYQLRPLNEDDLDIVLEWRNSDRIRNNMYNDRIILAEEHKNWFHRIVQKDNESYLLFRINNVPTGLVYFNDIDLKHKHCLWGFYIGDPQAPKGSGTILGLLGLDFVFSTFDMIKVYGDVLSYNSPSLKFHEKLGFTNEGRFIRHIEKKGEFFDVIRYALFKHEWDVYRKEIINHLLDRKIDLSDINK